MYAVFFVVVVRFVLGSFDYNKFSFKTSIHSSNEWKFYAILNAILKKSSGKTNP